MPDLLQHNPGSKTQGSGGGDPNMRVFDGIISATSPHLLTRWRVQMEGCDCEYCVKSDNVNRLMLLINDAPPK